MGDTHVSGDPAGEMLSFAAEDTRQQEAADAAPSGDAMCAKRPSGRI
jgi:hypothetical protein